MTHYFPPLFTTSSLSIRHATWKCKGKFSIFITQNPRFFHINSQFFVFKTDVRVKFSQEKPGRHNILCRPGRLLQYVVFSRELSGFCRNFLSKKPNPMTSVFPHPTPGPPAWPAGPGAARWRRPGTGPGTPAAPPAPSAAPPPSAAGRRRCTRW